MQNHQEIAVVKGTLRKSLLEFEKILIKNTLQKYNGNVTKAAQELGILRQNLHYRIRKFGIQN